MMENSNPARPAIINSALAGTQPEFFFYVRAVIAVARHG